MHVRSAVCQLTEINNRNLARRIGVGFNGGRDFVRIICAKTLLNSVLRKCVRVRARPSEMDMGEEHLAPVEKAHYRIANVNTPKYATISIYSPYTVELCVCVYVCVLFTTTDIIK